MPRAEQKPDNEPSLANMAKSTADEAVAATEAERSMGLVESLRLYRKACLWSIFLSTCIIMEGFDTVILANLYAYPPFKRKFGVLFRDGSYQLTTSWQSGLTNGALCGQILGLFFNGIIADRFGYRRTLIGALGLCCAFISVLFTAETLTQLLVGEILIGIPWGVFQTLTATYAAEVCPTHLRAYLTTYINMCWVIGQFVASGVLRAILLRDDDWGYKIPFALEWMFPVPLAVGIYLAPESPWWLVRRRRLEDAKQSLARLTTRNSGVAFRPDETLSMMVHTNEMEKEATAGTTYRDLFRGVNLRRTEIVCVSWMIQTLCGSSLIANSTYYYEQIGFQTDSSFSLTFGQYALGALGTIISWFLMGVAGRRTLYLAGQLCMIALLLVMGCASYAGTDRVVVRWSIGSMMLVFILAYNSTVGPVCYSLVSELSSTRLRTKSVVLARNMYNLMGIAANIATPIMLNPSATGMAARSALVWACSGALCAVWIYFRLPEPKGRTYGELDVLFENRVSARKFSTTPVDRFEAHGESSSEGEKPAEAVMLERVVRPPVEGRGN